MHSSRMRTGRSLTVCWSLFPGGCLLRGCLLPGRGCLLGGVSAPGGVCSQGVSAPGGCLLPGVVCSRGVCSGVVCSWGGLLQGGSAPGGSASDTPPPVNRMTDRCKNITLATTSLRPVIMVQFCPCDHIDRSYGVLETRPPLFSFPWRFFLEKKANFTPTFDHPSAVWEILDPPLDL